MIDPADLVANHATLLEGDDALAERGHDVGVVGGHQDRHAEVVDAQKQLDDLPADQRVEVAGRLVGDDEARVVDERPSDRRPLLLAAGELVRQLGPLGGQPDEREDPVDRGPDPFAGACR